MYEITNSFVQNCMDDIESPVNILPLCCLIFVNDRVVSNYLSESNGHLLDDTLSRKEPQVSFFSDSANGISQCESARKEARTASSTREFYDRMAVLRSFYDANLSSSFSTADLPRDRPVGLVLVVASP